MRWEDSGWICPKCGRYINWSNWGLCPWCKEKTGKKL